MKRILFSFLILGTFLVNTAEAKSRFEIKQMVIEEAMENETVPVSLALAVAKVESDFNHKALSSAGARGVMQIMPATAKGEFGVTANRLWNAELNIELGIRFLEQLYEQYDDNWILALSHYNGGTIKNNRPHSYTKTYINRVQKWQRVYEEQAQLWAHKKTTEVARYEEQEEHQTEWDDDRFVKWDDQERHVQNRYEELFEEETQIIVVERPRYRNWDRARPPRHHRFHHRPRPGRGFY